MTNEQANVLHDLKNEGGRIPIIIKALDRAIKDSNWEAVNKILMDLDEGSTRLGVLISEAKSQLQAVEEAQDV